MPQIQKQYMYLHVNSNSSSLAIDSGYPKPIKKSGVESPLIHFRDGHRYTNLDSGTLINT